MGSHALPVRSTQASRTLVILAVSLITLSVFGFSLKTILGLGLHNDRYLQIVVAPLACALLLFFERSAIFSRPAWSPRAGIPLLSASVLLGIFSLYFDPAARLPFAVLAMVLMWMAAFILCCGADSFRAGIYPLSCLFLMIPLPAGWMDQAATWLQHGSAAAAFEILRLPGIPVFRHGMVFSLPGLDFEVGPECSGIHSSLALMMIAIVAGYIFLRSGWTRLVLIALTIPIALLKNAIRIVVITLLGARVDRAFFDGPFHHRYGGLVFSAVAVLLFVLLLAGLQAVERRPWSRRAGDHPDPSLVGFGRESRT
jgi:exosortase